MQYIVGKVCLSCQVKVLFNLLSPHGVLEIHIASGESIFQMHFNNKIMTIRDMLAF